MRKKLLTLFLVSSMILSAMPMTAMAADTTAGGTTQTETTETGKKESKPTPPAALEENGKFNEEGVFVLSKDVTLTGSITIADDETLIIDLAGHTIQAPTGYATAFVVEGDLTIINTKETEASITCDQQNWSGIIHVHQGGKLTINENIKIFRKVGWCIVMDRDCTNEAEINLNGCTITGVKGFDGTNNNGAAGLTINGNVTASPTIMLNDVTIDTPMAAVYLAGNGSTTITGNTKISSTIENGVEIRAGALNIDDDVVIEGGKGDPTCIPNNSGGTTTKTGLAIAQHTTKQPIKLNIGAAKISGGAAVQIANPHNNSADHLKEIKVNIDGATLTSTNSNAEKAYALNVVNEADKNITGINVTVSNTKMAGKVELGDSKQVVLENCTKVKADGTTEPIADVTAVATVDGVQYTDWDAAVTAATSAAKPLVLEADKDLGAAFLSNISVDLNGHNLTSANTDGTIQVTTDTVTLTDSKGGGSIANKVSDANVVNVASGGTLVLNGATIKGTTAAAINNAGIVTVTKGTIEGAKAIDTTGTGSVTVNDGTIDGTITTATTASLSVNGGKFKSSIPAANWASGVLYCAKDADGYYSYHKTKAAAWAAAGSDGSVVDREGDAVANPDASSNNNGSYTPPYRPEGGGSSSGSGSTGSTDTDTSAATGWKQENGKWFYVNEDGSNATGWKQVKGTWYYMFNDGTMATGWQKVNGTWYYLKDWGGMATGWQKVGSTWYYLKSSGAMATGWQQVSGAWYYLKDWGGMVSNTWQNVGGKSYYFYQSGAMAANTTTPDGYKVGADGAWIK